MKAKVLSLSSVATLACALLAASLVPNASAQVELGKSSSFSIDGRTINGKPIDLVAEGIFVATSSDDYEIVPWKDLTPGQASDLRKNFAEGLRHLRGGAVWIIGTVTEVVPGGVIVYSDGRPRSQYVDSLNVPKLDPEQPRPRRSRGGAPKVNGWFIVQGVEDGESKINQVMEAVAFPTGETMQLALDADSGLKDIPIVNPEPLPWMGVQAWTNTEGKTMQAELVLVFNDQCIFELAGRSFAYPRQKLQEQHQETIDLCLKMAQDVFIDATAKTAGLKINKGLGGN